MLTCHELFGFMSPELANEILEYTFTKDKEMYRATVAAVAQARKVRPVFLERKARKERHVDMAGTLAKPAQEMVAGNLIRSWLLNQHGALLADFLNSLGISHKDGAVEDLPPTMEDEKLKAAVDGVLGKHPREVVTVYLHAFNATNDVRWPGLAALLQNDARLQF